MAEKRQVELAYPQIIDGRTAAPDEVVTVEEAIALQLIREGLARDPKDVRTVATAPAVVVEGPETAPTPDLTKGGK